MIAIAPLTNCGRALKPLLVIEAAEIAAKTEKKPAKTADCMSDDADSGARTRT